jgi:hypothetical protein
MCACNPTQPASSSSAKDEVAKAVALLMKGIEDADEAVLNRIAADELVYGHSSGKVQNKAEFIAEIVSGEPLDYVNIQLSEQSITVVAETAIVRHVFTSETVSGGVSGKLRIGNVLVWQLRKGEWKLLARQAYR